MNTKQPKTLGDAAFLLGLAALTLALIPACGGNGTASAPPPTVATSVITKHISTTSGPHNVPGLASTLLLREVIFTPTSASDEVIRVEVTGNINWTAGANLHIGMDVVDALGVSLMTDSPSNAPGLMTGASTPFRFVTHLSVFRPISPPDLSQYKLRLYAVSSSSDWVGSVDSLTFKITALEGVTILAPSGQISG